MTEHVTEWLNAFLDGELKGLRLGQVRDHLARCAPCRAELEQLQSLSQMLKEAAPAVADQPADRFIAELTLMLPRREGGTTSLSKRENIGRWLAPASVVAAWAFLQAVLTLGGLIDTARSTGLLDGAASWFSNGPQHSAWFLASLGLFGSHLTGNGLTLLSVLDGLGVLRSDLSVRLAWQAGIDLLYWAGLIFWWTRLAGQPSSLQTLTHSLEQLGQENPRAQ
jgi:Putative zinc-finger